VKNIFVPEQKAESVRTQSKLEWLVEAEKKLLFLFLLRVSEQQTGKQQTKLFDRVL
jgi:hypothetical protein